MKRIVAVLVVALVGLAACTKIDPAQLDGTYRSAARQEIVITGGVCVSYQEADSGVLVTGFETNGRYPNFTYVARSQQPAGLTIQAHFAGADTFTADVYGVALTGDGGTIATQLQAMQFKRISANFQQTKTGTN